MADFIKKKLVINGSVGKTSRIVVNTAGLSPEQDLPKANIYMAEIAVDDHQMGLSLWDTAGPDKYHRLHPEADVCLVCFSIENPDSLNLSLKNGSPRFADLNKTVSIC